MNLEQIISSFNLPGVAAEQLRAMPSMTQRSLDTGVSLISGHDKGISYRFYTHTVFNEGKSKLCKYKVYEEIDMIQWFVDRRSKPTEIALRKIIDPLNPSGFIYKTELPEELLAFDEEGNCIGGKYQESFIRYKEGRSSPGIPLSKWGVLSDALVSSLAADGIFSVEQLASRPPNSIKKYPQEVQDAYEQAISWESSKDMRGVAAKQSEEILKLNEETKLRDKQIEELRAQLAMLTKPKGKRKIIQSLEDAPNID